MHYSFTMNTCILKCSLVLCFFCFVICDPTYNSPPNQNWRCSGCKSLHHRSVLFGQLRAAIYREDRASYIALDTSWFDQLLEPFSRVHVQVVQSTDLGGIIMPDPQNSAYGDRFVKEEFQVVIVEQEANSTQWDSATISHFQGYLNVFQEIPLFPAVDSFLTHNPCWLPVYEPFIKQNGSTHSSTNAYPVHNNGGARRRGGRGHFSSARHLGSKLLILVRLPRYGFAMTCSLFTALTRLQFPSKCDISSNTTIVHYVSNIGFAHTMNAFLQTFARAISEGKRFMAPRAEEFLGRIIGHEGRKSGWAWAEPLTCPKTVYLNDPWACNFLSITNCSDRAASDGITPEVHYIWDSPDRFVRNVVGVTNDARHKYSDGSDADENRWIHGRMKGFTQRPNMWLRELIRKSIRAVHTLPFGSGAQLVSGPGGAGGRAALREHDRGGAGAGLRGKLSSSGVDENHLVHYGANKQGPCLVMHVRHGDASLDSRRETNLDRSFEWHLRHARNLSIALGARKIFLATDNATLVDLAPALAPEFTWYAQQRPMSTQIKMYLMFAKPFDDLPGMQNFTGWKETTVGGVQSDLSHVLADTRLAAKCMGIVGYFDSGLTAEIYRTMCYMGSRGTGKCPPSIDLREPQLIL